YFTPNQIFFMLAAFRIEALKAQGLLSKYDWFVTRSVATTRSVAELAARAGLPSADVRVGFKYMGTFAEWAENRKDPAETFISPAGNSILLGANPRPLIMCEESGGAIFGGTKPLSSKAATRSMLALREKDGMQIAALALSLAAHLYNSGRPFADYYCDNIAQANIKHRYFNRRDLSLYDESLTGAERQSAREEGIARRDRVMKYFNDLARKFASGKPPGALQEDLNSKLPSNGASLPLPTRICDVGDGTLLEFEPYWCVIRASGTDAVLRYYIEGQNRQDVADALNSFTTLQI